jgi:predicted TIM-barrel fold metal-dependent hydrolase
MKILCTIFLVLSISLHLSAQVEVKQNPVRGYRQRIKELIDTMRIVDTHEHLYNPDYLKQSTLMDFMLLFQMHNIYDFISAGLSPSEYLFLQGDSLSPVQKWRIIKPYWDGSSNTGYNRISLLAADKLFDIDEINENTVIPLSEKIKKAYQTDWFNNVIVKKCNIEYIIQDDKINGINDNKVLYVNRFTSWLTVRSKYRIDSIAVTQISQIRTLEDFVSSLESSFRQSVEKGMVAVKISVAYSRPLNFENVKVEAARKVFRSMMDSEEEKKFTFAESKPLQDYMLFRLLDLAKKYKLPVVIHTGLQAGNRNRIDNSNPILLSNLFEEYPEIKFSLFHGSYPYGGELAAIAKTFPNVYIDMCWLYAISPSYSERYLHEWIETVPANKIMAFGGDYNNVENIYGELLVAKQIITRVLTDKVRERYISEDKAKMIAKMILHDNAIKFYNLK